MRRGEWANGAVVVVVVVGGLKASCDRTQCEPALADGLAGQMF